MDFLNTFMVPIIVGICLCVGYIIKKWIKDVDNKWIPTIVTALGLIISIWMNNWTVTPDVVLGGLVSGLASTGMHQLFTQFIEKN
jgi:Na+/glutamate symporter